MARGKHRRNKEKHADLPKPSRERPRWHHALKPETKKTILAIFLFVIAAITLLSFWGKAGVLGAFIRQVLYWLFGQGYFFAPVTLVLVAFSLLLSFKEDMRAREAGEGIIGRHLFAATIIGGVLFLGAVLGLLNLFSENRAGGYVGLAFSYPFFKLFDFWAAIVIECGILIIALLMLVNTPLPFLKTERAEEEDDEDAEGAHEALQEVAADSHATGVMAQVAKMIMPAAEDTRAKRPERLELHAEENALIEKRKAQHSGYKKPPLSILNSDKGTPSSGDIRANANIIKRTLQNFGIEVEMDEVSVGPTVTQYTLKPAEGVKLSRISALQSNLALALAAHPIRIEAPIPGKSLVGIEIPNRSIALVGLRSLIEAPSFQDAPAPLVFSLGRDVAGEPVHANLAKMPHLLISGSTGSGKTVNIHTIVTSLLFRNPPEILRFIFIDPKRVELVTYNEIPHLLCPVITEPKKAVMALRWAVREMDKRYEMLSEKKVRDLVGYNARMVKDGDGELMPYVIIVIDELADLMMSFPREAEAAIVRIAQMARAVGIHLVISTQRPSVEVITGLIKANIPARIAFRVASQIDSRTILDMAGAEKLLGNGDMLFLGGDTATPRRIQGAFVSEGEVKKVVEFLKNLSVEQEYQEDIFSKEAITETSIGDGSMASGKTGLPAGRQGAFDDFGSDGDDELYEEARKLVVETGKASASFLQRRLKVGYARAARLLDMLEEGGIVGPGDGAKAREIFVARNGVGETEDEEHVL